MGISIAIGATRPRSPPVIQALILLLDTGSDFASDARGLLSDLAKKNDTVAPELLSSLSDSNESISRIVSRAFESAMNDGCARKILDLTEVTLIDIAVVRFLMRCEDDGIELAQSPPYVREWIVRERAEGVQQDSSDDN